MNPFLSVTIATLTASRRSRYQSFAINMYRGDPDVLRERLKAATTPDECDEIFSAWCDEATKEPPK